MQNTIMALKYTTLDLCVKRKKHNNKLNKYTVGFIYTHATLNTIQIIFFSNIVSSNDEHSATAMYKNDV